jgi:hypothetical protein
MACGSLAGTAIALAGCGGSGDEGDEAGTTATPSESVAGGEAEPILIKTRVNIPTGKILDGSTIGDSPFCPGGTVKDKHGTSEIGLVDRTITCQDGTLRMGFDPHEPVNDTQSGPWRIISGTGAYEGWKGSGQMEMKYDPNDKPQTPHERSREVHGDRHALAHPVGSRCQRGFPTLDAPLRNSSIKGWRGGKKSA